VAPNLAQEMKLRPGWMAYRFFPLAPGDALVRDVRLWHGGCPNLSREARYLPSFEVASKGVVDHFAHCTKPWPKRGLPASYASAMSSRARRVCQVVEAPKEDKYVNRAMDSFDWLKWQVHGCMRRNHFLPGGHLGAEQSHAISMRACLERVESLTAEPLAWLESRLRDMIPVDMNTTTLSSSSANVSGRTLAAALLSALEQQTGKKVFAESDGDECGSLDNMCAEKLVHTTAAHLFAWLQLRKQSSLSPYRNRTKVMIAFLASILCFLFRSFLKRSRSRPLVSIA